jgi:hypothetical protein
MKCLAKKPADRYASALELRTALLALAPATDWSTQRARAWWEQYRVALQQVSEAGDVATLAITVDLGQRVGNPT